MKTPARRWFIGSLSVLASLWSLPAQGQADVKIGGKLATWHAITLDVAGPQANEDADPNPFTDIRLSVTFTSGGASYEVPGYFAADGDAGDTGASAGGVWRAHFVPDRPGAWRYTVSFRRGPRVSISLDRTAGQAIDGDGQTGTFEIAAGDRSRGLLRYVGKPYLRFAGSGEYFIKGGADSPENFLAYFEFDGDHSDGESEGAPREGEAAPAPRHKYAPHTRDWRPGDPTWGEGKGKGIVGALNYLAWKGVNSIYFLTMNVKGDGDDVWPYSNKKERFRFDCSKLDQWEIVFRHMDELGLMMHVVLTETENEHLFELEEGGSFADRRKLYYRELIARFAHHRAVVWNIGEENGWDDRHRETTGAAGRANTHEQRKAFASYIREVDPYDHAIVVHTLPGRYDEIYTPLLGYPAYEGPSLQVKLGKGIHDETIRWLDRSSRAGRQWVVTLDEIGPAGVGVKPDADDPEHDEVRRYALWGNLMAGGAGCEWYFGYKFAHNDLGLEDFRSRERMWDQTRYAVEFFQKHLPFISMRHADELVSNEEAYCFANPGKVYAVYIPKGGATEIWLPEARYRVAWYNPRRGGALQIGPLRSLRGGGYRSVGRPPRDPERDWVALVELDGEAPEKVPEPPPRAPGERP